MKAWILYPSTTPQAHNAFSWFIDAAAAHDIELQVHFFEDLPLGQMRTQRHLFRCADGSLHDLDFVIMRGYDFDLSLFFEGRGIPVFNSSLSMALSRNKIATHRILEAAGISTPRTLYLGKVGLPLGVLKEGDPLCAILNPGVGGEPVKLEYGEVSEFFGNGTFVAKQISGSKGENVYLINNKNDFGEALEECAGNLGLTVEDPALAGELLFQEYISTSYGRDVRVWVVGDRVSGCVLRHNEHSFKSNFAQGGGASAFDLPPEAARLAVRAANALGLSCSGIDLLFCGEGKMTSERFTVCEVNGNAGFRTASLVNQKINIPVDFLHYIVNILGKRKI